MTDTNKEDIPQEEKKPEELSGIATGIVLKDKTVVIEEKGDTIGTSDIKKKEVVGSISASDFKKMQEQMIELKSNQKMLEQIADKRQLEYYYNKQNKKMPSTYVLRTFKVAVTGGRLKDKLVMKWKLVENDVYKDPMSNVWKERQIIEVTFRDNTKKQFPLAHFAKNYNTILCEKEGEETDIEENKFVTLRVIEPKSVFVGEKIKMNILYVN